MAAREERGDFVVVAHGEEQRGRASRGEGFLINRRGDVSSSDAAQDEESLVGASRSVRAPQPARAAGATARGRDQDPQPAADKARLKSRASGFVENAK
jgi:hypothetical protein